jgi:hypothetical protein
MFFNIADLYLSQTRLLILELLDLLPKRSFAVELYDGTVFPQNAGLLLPDFILVLRNPKILRRMLLPPNELAFGEGYINGDYDQWVDPFSSTLL